MRRLLFATVALLGVVGIAWAEDYEEFHIEFSPQWWLVSTSGSARSGATAVDLESDLGIRNNKSHFVGKLVLKPARKHRVLFDVLPFRLNGGSALTRTIDYAGQTYNIREQVTSEAKINYLFGGYQYDAVSRERGHLGIQAGVGYLNAEGTIRSSTTGRSSTEDIDAPLPLVGVEFRGFPLAASNLLNFNGEIRGMSLGRYGRYVQAGFNVGFSFGRHFTVQAGYAFHDIDVHDTNRSEVVKPRFSGPVVSLQFRD
ncbi:MAG: hypothetical protein L0387_16310 [Acidobacteria bacterium]|nr:hypothetical protein [Acidobacteriota bacterium]MCI0623192.1 hypothetical protein [Acidobacteriota bacterium]MCI0724570.1 hypothetical protein [Acidobacteriota bacterium]